MRDTTTSIISHYESECMEQPERLAALFRFYEKDRDAKDSIRGLKSAIAAEGPVVWLGMGASLCSAMPGATRLSLLGRPSFAVEASEWLHYAITTSRQVAGPILVTTSGQSAELVELCERRDAEPTVLVCNEPESPCWVAADIHFPILAGTELGNATKSYTNSAAVCSIIGSELIGWAWREEISEVLNAFSATLELAFRMRNEISEFCSGVETIEIVGRGGSLAGAVMGALCLREMTAVRCSGHSGGGFRHGPLLDVSANHVAIIMALGRTTELGFRLARDCLAKGGKVVLIHAAECEECERLLPVRIAAVPEPWESITSVVVPQALTMAMIEQTGSNYVRLQTTVE